MAIRPIATSTSTPSVTTSEAQLTDAEFEAMLEEADRIAIEEAAKERSTTTSTSTTTPTAAAAAAAAGSSKRASPSVKSSTQDRFKVSPDGEDESIRQLTQMMGEGSELDMEQLMHFQEESFWKLLAAYTGDRREFDAILEAFLNTVDDWQSEAVDNEDLIVMPYGQSGKFVKIEKNDLSHSEKERFAVLSMRVEALMKEHSSSSSELEHLVLELGVLIQSFLKQGKAKIIEKSDLPAPTLSAESVSQRRQFLSLLGVDKGLHQSMSTHKEFDSKVITALFDVLSKHNEEAHVVLKLLLSEKMTRSDENAYCAFHKELQSSFPVEKFAKLRDHFVACLIKLLQPQGNR
jgi:hypothetical protein